MALEVVIIGPERKGEGQRERERVRVVRISIGEPRPRALEVRRVGIFFMNADREQAPLHLDQFGQEPVLSDQYRQVLLDLVAVEPARVDLDVEVGEDPECRLADRRRQKNVSVRDDAGDAH